MGVYKNHCQFTLGPEQTYVLLKPTDKKAVEYIRVNGYKLKDMNEVKLAPNDRICIGPSAVFLFKNTEHDDKASKPDTVAEPITYDDADAEIQEALEKEDDEDAVEIAA